jgi:NAD(P)-dependent dehydrogenase (short-subunit alcohol dehydrogenase family)
MRLKDKVAIVVGAGQTPGEGLGNGRATALLFAKEGARVLAVDRDTLSLEETREQIEGAGGVCTTQHADILKEGDCEEIARACVRAFGRIDILHNNVGIGTHDSSIVKLDTSAWDNIMDTNLKGMALTCKHVLPVMRRQRGGAIVNVSSIAAIVSYPLIAYKVSKAGVNALTQLIASSGAKYGIRANAIMPGLINTPMAIEGHSTALNVPREELIRRRDAQVPLGKMGTAWDVAYAALFLASDEAGFITGVIIPVDGGQSGQVGGSENSFGGLFR